MITSDFSLVYNYKNFVEIKTAITNGSPIHLMLGFPVHYAHRTGLPGIELCISPLTSFHGLVDWDGMGKPQNYCLCSSPGRFCMHVKMFDRRFKLSWVEFKKHGFSRFESALLEHFLNALVDPEGKYAQNLEKWGRKWGTRHSKSDLSRL